MQTGYILGFFILPIFLEGCCDENYQKEKTGLRQDAVCRHYKAVEGEIFMMPCIESVNMEAVCSRTGEGREGNKSTSFVCGRKFLVEAKHSGKYTCRSLLSSGSELFFHLQVVERISLGPGCFQPEEIRELVLNKGGKIPCPGLNCSNNTDVIWYKGMTAVSRLSRSRGIDQKDGWLHLFRVYPTDTDVFFCDRQTNDSGVIWTFRRAVNVSVILDEASYRPRIMHPENNTKEKVELGQCHTLMCKVYFPFEKKFSREVQWYINYSGNTENMTLLPMEEQQQERMPYKEHEVIRRAIIKEVTPQHLNYRYTCIAGNNVGTSSHTIQLVEKIKGLWQDAVCRHYKAVEGEIFMMPCIESVNMEAVCSRTGEGREGNKSTSFVCGRKFLVEAKHSGKYTCRSLLSSGSELFFHLQVVERISLCPGCFQPEEIRELVLNKGGKIPCPGLNCSNNTDVIWYKGMTAVSRLSRSTYQKDGWLHLFRVYTSDTDVFFCDRQTNDSGVIWTFRRAVNVSVIPTIGNTELCDFISHAQTVDEASYRPRIMHPENNTKEKVELGQCHTLMCKVYFPFEKKFSREVQWYINYSGNTENMTLLPMEEQQQERMPYKEHEVIRRAIITEVTPQHLNYRYTCIAGNNVGTSSHTIQLVEKIKVKWSSLVGYPIVFLLLVAVLGTVLHVKWLEIKLIYRSRFQHGKQHGDEKEFDVFLSYVWSSQSAELEGVLTLSPRRGPDSDEEACLSSMDPPNTEEGKSTQRPLEVLLPRALEDRWGYRLCLLERDVPPGGAYTNDVVLAIKRSQMLICLLSADYLSNSNAVFELESGIQALLQNSSLKLLLIWTSGASASLIQPDPPLPPLVQRALKVLPSLDWTSGKPARATSNFWRSLRKAMPDQRVKLSSLMQDQ